MAWGQPWLPLKLLLSKVSAVSSISCPSALPWPAVFSRRQTFPHSQSLAELLTSLHRLPTLACLAALPLVSLLLDHRMGWVCIPACVCVCVCVYTHTCSVMFNFFGSLDCSSARLLFPCDFPCKNTGMNCHSFLQEIFLTQGSNLGLGLLHC